MTKLYQCDRCGKNYTKNLSTLTLEYLPFKHIGYDFCKKCSNDFKNFMNEKKGGVTL